MSRDTLQERIAVLEDTVAALEAENAELLRLNLALQNDADKLATADAAIHALLAELAALKVRLAAGVEASIRIGRDGVYPALIIEPIDQPAPVWKSLDGKRVIVVEATDNAREGKEG